MQVWKSATGAAPYAKVGLPQDVSASNPRTIGIFNIASFSTFTSADGVNPLPLGLISFTAARQKEGVLLNWTMTNEKAWSTFAIERSVDGKSFAPIASITALPNGRSSNVYTYLDKAFTRDSYYRITLTDANGETDRSSLVYVQANKFVSRAIALYPNPTANGATLTINNMADLEEDVTVSIYTLDGRPVATHQGQLQAVNAQLATDVAGFAAGMYQIRVITTDQVQAFKLVKE
jgi:hypothetical protein